MLSRNVRDRLRELTKQFTQQLPSRLQAIHSALGQLEEDPGSAEALQQIRSHAHRLAGSGSTFGYQTISTVSRELEHLVAECLDSGEPVDSASMAAIREMAENLDRSFHQHAQEAQESPGESTPEDEGQLLPVGEREHRRNADSSEHCVAVLARGDDASADIESQLGFFGFSVVAVSDLGELEALVEEGDGLIILVADLREIPEDADAALRLKALRTDNNALSGVILFSRVDSFDERLRAVRSGGDAFFPAPVEVLRLVDKIETLFGTAQYDPYHVLVVDDDHEQVSFLALILQQAGMITSVVTEANNVFQVLTEAKPEIILMDMYMPGCSGIELARIIRQQEAFIGIPIIFLSVEQDREKQLQAISEGGDDFIAKPVQPEYLVTAVRMKAQRTRDMRFFMERDSLTGLLNHSNLLEKVEYEIQRAGRIESSLTFAMIDLDHFKSVNDTYGHLTGDRVLKSLSRLLRERLRKTDVIGRYGGEEFGVILLDTTPQAAFEILDRIRQSFARIRHSAENRDFYVTLSCGLASYPNYDNVNDLTEAADRALYTAKESGRDQLVSG
ncbi:MAG: diguanylate cyclase [Spirochaetes bacterium]|jgi:diguanylate cyclase (GGDEF)-like protein|nr:diguanylate cyclase [Spirochaetota bacterium]